MELPVLAVPADVIGDGDLSRLVEGAHGDGSVFALSAPEIEVAGAEPLSAAVVTVVCESDGPSPIRQGTGWGARVRSFEDARVLGHAILMGLLPERDEVHRWPIIVHGHEREKGIWLARGASYDRGATLAAPVWLGRGAVIAAGAEVGPDVFLGDRAVIASSARVEASFIAAETMVGEGVGLRRHVAYRDRMHGLAGLDDLRQVDDRRILASRYLVPWPGVRRAIRYAVLLLMLALLSAIVWYLVG